MPFTKECGFVSRRANGFRDGRGCGCKSTLVGYRFKAHFSYRSTLCAVDGVDTMARCVLTTHQGCTAGLAVCGGGIPLGKHNTCFGKRIDVGCLKCAIVVANIFPTEVICDNQQYVGLVCCNGGDHGKRQANQCTESLSEKCIFHFQMPSQIQSPATISNMFGLSAAMEGLTESVKQIRAQRALVRSVFFISRCPARYSHPPQSAICWVYLPRGMD